MRLNLNGTTEMLPLSHRLLLSLFVALVPLQVRAKSDNTVVKLHYGSFQGKVDGGIIQFLGMPFAAPPYAEILFCVFVR